MFRRMLPILLLPLVAIAALLPASPASAHSYSAFVFANITETDPGVVRVLLDMD